MEDLKRFDRIIAILIQLQSKKVVRAQDLAERFQVSLRTIYRDVRSLESAGVALYGEAGNGYSLMKGYRLPPVMFTREEAGSFVAAEKLMQKFSDNNIGAHFGSAMFKVKSVLKDAEKDWVAALESRISVFSAQKGERKELPFVLDKIFSGLAEKKRLKIEYLSLHSEKKKTREIEAVGLFHENQFWYIFAYCHLRKDYRQFRIDRIKGIEVLDRKYTNTHPSVEELRNHNKEKKEYTHVKLLVDKQVVRYIQYDRDNYGFVSEKEMGERVEMNFLVSGVNSSFVRWYLMFADYAKILEPSSFKEKVRDLLKIYQHNLQ